MKKYEFISVILVYRNFDDLEECVISTQEKIQNCRCIVVNAYYDDGSMQRIQEIAKKYDCDFLNIENKGYSYGNNYGISYAREHYEYKYIIVSNPDIIIRKFDMNAFDTGDIWAPTITALTGKAQNPLIISRNRLYEFLIYQGHLRNRPLLFYAGVGINKILRTIGLFFFKLKKSQSVPVYAAHGSFVILSKKAIDLLAPVYDEAMFLFMEEQVLAMKAKQKTLKTIYTRNIDVLHKEDGSMKFIGKTVNKELKKATIYFYENYVKTEHKM